MFDFLKPNKVELSVSLDRPSTPYYAGETLHAIVTLKAQKELNVQEARIALVCRERYQVRSEDEDTDSDGHTTTKISTSWQTSEQEIARQVIMKDGTIPGDKSQSYEFVAAIPSDAPVTWKGGKIVELKWLVKATLDRKLATDFNGEAEALVLSVAPGHTSAGTFGQSNALGDVGLAFSLPGKEWVTGDAVEGQLLITPRKDLDVNEIRVELERLESVPAEKGNTARTVQTVKLSGKGKLVNGQVQAAPFRLAIPTSSPVTGTTANCSVTWLLRAVLARGFLKSDFTVDEEIFVYSARPG